MSAFFPCLLEPSQEKKSGLSQEKSQEKNSYFNYGLSQEKKCEQRRFDVAAVEDAVRRVLGFEDDGHRCPLPGHYGGVAYLELRATRPGQEFVCNCLGTSAEWDHENVWRSDYARSLSNAYEAVRTGRVIERGSKLSKGERFVASLLLAHAVGLLEPVDVALVPLASDAPEIERRAWGLFGLIAGLRLAWMTPEDALPMPFAGRLVAAYLGVDRNVARAVINALREQHVIEVVAR
ncbi:MAG: hypothetical protein H0W08_18020 [Acidobacteria bacterium]|nr:hypothetical protein [Acidobacteriota bacterium]